MSKGIIHRCLLLLKKEVPRIKTAFYYNWINLFYPHNKKNFDEVSYLDDDAYIQNYTKAFDFIVKNKKRPNIGISLFCAYRSCGA